MALQASSVRLLCARAGRLGSTYLSRSLPPALMAAFERFGLRKPCEGGRSLYSAATCAKTFGLPIAYNGRPGGGSSDR